MTTAIISTITLTLPWPPSVNRYWRSVLVGKGNKAHMQVLVSKEGRQYKRDVIHARPAFCGPPATLTGRLLVHVTLCAPTRRKYDLDNRMKALLDAMQHAGVYADDEQIDTLQITRGRVAKPGSAIVEIREIR